MSGGSLLALRRVELNSELSSSIVVFPEASSLFDISTDVRKCRGSAGRGKDLSSLFNRYGWSITNLDIADGSLIGLLAAEVNDAIKEKGLKLRTVVLDSSELSSWDLSCMDQLIARSSRLQDFQLDFSDESEIEGAHLQMWRRLTKLSSYIKTADTHLGQLAGLFPSRRDVPQLESLDISCCNRQDLPGFLVAWLAKMVSSPLALSESELASSSDLIGSNDAPHSESEAASSWRWKPLKHFKFNSWTLKPDEWKTIID
jgi:hypothetical protein